MEEVSGISPSSGREPHGLGSLLLNAGRNVKGKLTGIQKLSLDLGKPRTLSQRDNLSAPGALHHSPALGLEFYRPHLH